MNVAKTWYEANVKERSISNDPKLMLPKCTHLWECKVNEKTSLYEHSNESIEINAYLILMMRWEII